MSVFERSGRRLASSVTNDTGASLAMQSEAKMLRGASLA